MLSWNLSDFELTSPAGLAADHRQAEQLAHIAQIAPDILCCQKLSGEHPPDRVAAGFEQFAAKLGMSGRISLRSESRPHVGVLWRDGITETGPWRPFGGEFERNAGVTVLDVNGHRLRLGSIHLPSSSIEAILADTERLLPFADPSLATVLAGDWNSVGESRTYDAGPDQPLYDRRATERLTEAGLIDVARHLSAEWRPTWGVGIDWPEIRIDAFRVSTPVLPAVLAYAVDETVDHLSLHRPIVLRLDPDRLPSDG